MSKYFIRVNGIGNAWPVLLGTVHPFYNPEDQEQLANVSFSILKSSSGNVKPENIEWEVLIDAGHGIVQYLIRHGNRLPDAVVLTHTHPDHTLSLDWITQSYYRYFNGQKKLPLYVSNQGWDVVSATFSQLSKMTRHLELKPGERHSIEGIPELTLTPLPVYHGRESRGSNMLIFELRLPDQDTAKIIFSGDVLCPLLRKADYRYLKDASMAFLDSNNRFPYMPSNHWSICSEGPDGKAESKYLKAFRQQLSCTQLIATNLPVQGDPLTHAYFDEFLAYCVESIPLSVFDFCKHVTPQKVHLVHYSGMEDRNFNDEKILNPVQLENWANAEAERRDITSEFLVPLPGDIFEIT